MQHSKYINTRSANYLGIIFLKISEYSLALYCHRYIAPTWRRKLNAGTYAGIDGGVLYRRCATGEHPGIWVGASPLLPSTLSSPLLPLSSFSPSLPLSSSPLRSRVPLNQLGGLGSAVSFSSGERGAAPSENEFGAL